MKQILILLLTLTLLQNCMDAFVYSETQKKTSSSPVTLILAFLGLSTQTSTTTGTGTSGAFTVSGTITGLTASGLVLFNGVDELTLSDGATTFAFPTLFLTGVGYAVTVRTQPTGLTCTVSNGVGFATADVTNVSVTCATTTYTIGGTITGLTASGLVLQNNAGDNLTVSSGATSFTFTTPIAQNSTYAVTVQTQPTGLTCTVSNGTGTATANVTNVSIICSTVTYTVAGTITGLTASGLVLQNNAGNNLTVSSGASSFTFTSAIAQNSTYAVTVQTQPTGLTCSVSNGTGTATANVTSVSVTCSATTYTIGGTITGLTASGLVLQNNAGNDLTVLSGASSFTFTTPIAHNSTYSVRVKTHPTGLICTESSATGTATANVSNVTIACSSSTRNWGVFTDNNDGTVSLAVTAGTWGGQTYTTQTLTWMKCTHGQTWNASTNDCTGSGSSPTYGATTVQYCNANDNSCNFDATHGFTNDLNGTGTSGAYTACNSLNAGAGTNGKTNWRVPTKNELKLLLECADATIPLDGGYCQVSGTTIVAINSYFPNIQFSDSVYWSSTINSATSNAAWNVAFGYYSYATSKTTSFPVRCVSVP